MFALTTSSGRGRRLVHLLMLSLLAAGFSQAAAQDSQQKGAFYTGEYPNALKEFGLTDEQIQERIDATF